MKHQREEDDSMQEDELREIVDEIRAYNERTHDYLAELAKESDRGAAILAVADFDNWLGGIVSGYFVKLNSELNKRLFKRGPLQNFSAKLDIGFALGLYDMRTLNNLRKINEIRNKFAHLTESLKFEDEPISVLCQNLDTGDSSGLDDSRSKYLNYLTQVKHTILTDLVNNKAEDRRTRAEGI